MFERARDPLDRLASIVSSIVYCAFVVGATLVEIVWWTVIATLALDWLGLPRSGEVAVAVVPIAVVVIRVEAYILEPRRAPSPRVGQSVARAALVHGDDFGWLWERGRDGFGEPIRVVEVVNATPEEDGSSRHYYLRVPSHVQTAREAIAWTFGLDGGDYKPVRES